MFESNAFVPSRPSRRAPFGVAFSERRYAESRLSPGPIPRDDSSFGDGSGSAAFIAVSSPLNADESGFPPPVLPMMDQPRSVGSDGASGATSSHRRECSAGVVFACTPRLAIGLWSLALNASAPSV